jgi:hypothetical protein
MFGTLINMGIPFTMLLISFGHILKSMFNIKLLAFKANQIQAVLVFILPVVLIIKLCNYNIKELENIKLSEDDYKNGRIYYFSFLILTAIFIFTVPNMYSLY